MLKLNRRQVLAGLMAVMPVSRALAAIIVIPIQNGSLCSARSGLEGQRIMRDAQMLPAKVSNRLCNLGIHEIA